MCSLYVDAQFDFRSQKTEKYLTCIIEVIDKSMESEPNIINSQNLYRKIPFCTCHDLNLEIDA